MNTEAQAVALQLADQLDKVPENGADPDLIERSSAELRRLHAENLQLRADLEAVGAGGVGPLMATATTEKSSAVPEGWKLVPVDLTKAMQAAGEAAWAESYSQQKNGILHMYRALLAAAPQPPETARSGK